MDIDNILLDIEKFYLNSLLTECTNKKINSSIIKDKLKNIDNNITETNSLTETDTYTEDYIYKKEWNKLHSTHKIIKLREFVNRLNINNDTEKKNLKKDLINLVKNKKLTKKNSVNYNSEKGLISSIPNLNVVNNKYEIKI